MSPKSRTIKVDYLARVEGEGALDIEFCGDKVTKCHLKIFEPPRFFESMLRGRMHTEAPDITARICGICPVAYQMSAVMAMEDAFSIDIPPEIDNLRTLLYCGEWIESHCLHIFMLHAPDLLGFHDAIELSKKYPDILKNGLALKKMGNQIIKTLGGREIHPINVRVGGFYKIPSTKVLNKLYDELCVAKDLSLKAFDWLTKVKFSEYQYAHELISLKGENTYPFMHGNIVSDRGLHIKKMQFEDNFQEYQVPHSNALHAKRFKGDNYLVGPMARFYHNHAYMTETSKQKASEWGVLPTDKNPFKSVFIRALEVIHAFDTAVNILQTYIRPDIPYVSYKVSKAEGMGCTEAPRGLLYHKYQMNQHGDITTAKIIPPTSQNQASIEKDLYHYVQKYHKKSIRFLQSQCEQVIRSYDPCISCATHFLKVNISHA